VATIEQRGDSWRVYWRLGGRGGAKQSTTWPTEAYAKQAADIAAAHRHAVTADWVYAQILGETETPEESSGPALSVWSAKWLAAKTRITPGTRAAYEAQLRERIFPWRPDGSDDPILGDRPLDRITPTDIGQMLNDILATGLKRTTVTRYYSLLHGILDAAVREGLIDANPAAQTDWVRDQVAEDDTGEETQVRLTHDEYQILRAAFDPDDQPLIDTLAGTGARWSEATALAVEHLVPATARSLPKVRIWRAWKRDGRGGWYLGTTKGRRKREIGITGTLAEQLAKLAKGRPKDAFVHRAPEGGPVHYSNFLNRRWNPALLRAMRCREHPPPDRGAPRTGSAVRCYDLGGVRDDGKPCGAWVMHGMDRCQTHVGPDPEAVSTCDCDGVLRKRPSPHDLRHTHAAWLFSTPGVTPLAISRRLGHAQLSTTSEIYGDLMPEAEDATVAAIGAAMAPGAAPAPLSAT
jgi:integrase